MDRYHGDKLSNVTQIKLNFLFLVTHPPVRERFLIFSSSLWMFPLCSAWRKLVIFSFPPFFFLTGLLALMHLLTSVVPLRLIRSCWRGQFWAALPIKRPSGGHRGDYLDHFAILSLDGTLDGVLHLHVCLQGWRKLSSLVSWGEGKHLMMNNIFE